MKKIIGHSFCLCTLFLTGVIGEIVQRPLNVATNIGGQNFLNCSSNINVGAMSWVYTTDCNLPTGTSLTVANCDLNNSYTANYKIEKPDEFTCNLIVYNAVLSLGGCYACADGQGQGRQYLAFLVIVDSNAIITPNSTDIISGEDVMINSTVSYKGPNIPLQPAPLTPSFYWTLESDPSQNITSHQGSTSYTSASSYIVVTAQPPNVPSYLCNLFFNSPAYFPPSCANNAPTYRRSWPTQTYTIFYPPQNSTISGTPNPCQHESTVVLTCSASGHPTPTYQWFDLSNGAVLSESSTVTIQRGGSYQCVASNTIRSVPYSASISVNVSNCVSVHNVSITASNGPCDSSVASCGDINSITLTCEASGFPEPEFKWSFPGGSAVGPTVVAKKNIAYECTAMNSYAGQEYSASATLQVYWIDVLICVNVGLSDPVCITMLVLVIFFGLNLICFTIFIIIYGCSESGRDTLNDRFSWLKKMLPCLNGEGCICSVWIVYFILLSIFAAFVFFPTILIMASCCPKHTKTSQVNSRNMPLSERNGRGVGGAQVIISGQPINQYPQRMSVTPNPPSSLDTSSLSLPEHPTHRPYPHSSDQQRQPPHWGNSADPYLQTPRQIQLPRHTPSPALSSGAIVYAELGVDNQPKSRRPIQPIQNEGNPYADIAIA